MTTKVTSVGSSSGVPNTPFPTPRTEASLCLDDLSPIDLNLNVVDTMLNPILEDLNESADAAMYPSPPINTPETRSPAPSVYKARGRGLSAIGDRLLQLKLEDRMSPRKDTDGTSSNRSMVASIDEDGDGVDGDDVASNGIVRSPCPVQNRHIPHSAASPPASIPIVLGSPGSNPRIEEYLTFTSSDLPVKVSQKQDSSSAHLATGHHLGLHSRENSIKSIKSDGAVSGVTEKSTWAEEVEDTARRAIMQLEQLALDEFTLDPSKTMEEYYIIRLQKILNTGDRKVKTVVSSAAKNEE